MKVLIACEESQTVCRAFRLKGHDAYSCDILDCSGGHPEWHIKGDALNVIKDKWDLIIAHPPCTRLTVAANKYYKPEYSARFPNIHTERKAAIAFFIEMTKANSEHICIENPIGIMSSIYRKPDQIIQPWQFGHTERKATCLWLAGLPKLKHTDIVTPDIIIHKSGRTDSRLHFDTLKLPKEERSRIRSKTFSGIATAMAEQWGNYLTEIIAA